MNSYVVDVSNSCERKETNKTVENLLEEYSEISKEIEDYSSSGGAIIFLFIIVVICSLSFDINFLVFLIPMILLSVMLVKIDKKENNKTKELEEIKIKLLTILKQEGFIIEHNNDDIYCSRFMLSLYAEDNESFYFANKRINAQKLLLKYPNIQKIVERKTYYKILKLHNKHQELINKLCKENESKKIIYETQ